MIQGTIAKIEDRIQEVGTLDDRNRKELLSLISDLKSEVTALSATQREQAESIAGFTAVSTHEATRGEKDPQLLKLGVKGLSSSVKGFEVSHPRLVQTVNAICAKLSDLGI